MTRGMPLENQGIKANLLYGVVAQGASLVASVIVSLVIPKILGVNDYAYWQLFSLYSSYTGITLLGINDGMYLRLGGLRFGDLNFSELKSQLIVTLGAQALLAFFGLTVLGCVNLPYERTLVLLLVFVYMLVNCCSLFFTYILQAVNLTQLASKSVFYNKTLFLLLLVLLIFLNKLSTWWLIVCFIAAQFIGLLYCMWSSMPIICARNANPVRALRQCVEDVRSGMKVMLAYYADTLILGFARMVADWKLGLAAFAQLSFSFSLMTFIIGFIDQAAMVVFPVIKRMTEDDRREKYIEIDSVLSLLLPVLLLSYIPISLLVEQWLPEYSDGIKNLAIVFPVAFFNCKVNLLYNTFLKVIRKESTLLSINCTALLVSIPISLAVTVLFKDISAVAVGIVIATGARGVLYELSLSKLLSTRTIKYYCSEILISVCFSLLIWFVGYIGVMFWFLVLIPYIALNRKRIREAFIIFKS